VDVTGGAPELHPHFREFIAALRDTGQSVQVRTNLIPLLEPSLAGMARSSAITPSPWWGPCPATLRRMSTRSAARGS